MAGLPVVRPRRKGEKVHRSLNEGGRGDTTGSSSTIHRLSLCNRKKKGTSGGGVRAKRRLRGFSIAGGPEETNKTDDASRLVSVLPRGKDLRRGCKRIG